MPISPRWAVLYDMDGTLLSKILGSLMRHVADHGLGPRAKKDFERLRATYASLFSTGRMPVETYKAWLLEEIELYVLHRLTVYEWQTALRDVRLREGVTGLIHDLHDAHVPQGVVSAAIHDFVEFVLEVNGVLRYLDAVYATRLTHARNVVTGFDPLTIVHPGNKGDASRMLADRFGVPHDRIIGVGDSPGDITIGHLKEHRIVIAESDDEARLLLSLDFMEEVVVSDDFHPVAAWIRRRIGLPH